MVACVDENASMLLDEVEVVTGVVRHQHDYVTCIERLAPLLRCGISRRQRFFLGIVPEEKPLGTSRLKTFVAQQPVERVSEERRLRDMQLASFATCRVDGGPRGGSPQHADAATVPYGRRTSFLVPKFLLHGSQNPIAILIGIHDRFHDSLEFPDELAVVDILESRQADTHAPKLTLAVVVQRQVFFLQQPVAVFFEHPVHRDALPRPRIGNGWQKSRHRHAAPHDVDTMLAENAFNSVLHKHRHFRPLEETVAVQFSLEFLVRNLALQFRNRLANATLVDPDHQFHRHELAHVVLEPLVVANDLRVFIEELEQLDRCIELGKTEAESEHDEQTSRRNPDVPPDDELPERLPESRHMVVQCRPLGRLV